MSVVLSRIVTLTAGTLYPAYRSYKAVRTKDVREYVKWMMYWIVFAIYTFVETLADIFISFWFPFYYQLKIVFVIWLLSPWTKGASILYRKVRPRYALFASFHINGEQHVTNTLNFKKKKRMQISNFFSFATTVAC
ncbi:TB2/DP1, HVA22 family [Ancylostoma caninum]|uniref:Receptor expression-enhancing protein n=1 Tax=Ancylostoma caninum TaxID=29170 RepID=A0A368H856_ANCCA|nr:TB2/DP1, HVA22 family [Ancylostoma caninum]